MGFLLNGAAQSFPYFFVGTFIEGPEITLNSWLLIYFPTFS